MEEKEKVPVSIITLVVGIVVTIISLWAGQNHGLLPEAASEQAPLVDRFFDIMFTIATGLFIIVEGTIVFCMIKFSNSIYPKQKQPHQTLCVSANISKQNELQLF